jgi:hypothetical protein
MGIKYRALERSFINNRIVEAGELVEYDGYPSENLEPLCEAGLAKAEEGRQVRDKAMAELIERASQPGFLVTGMARPQAPKGDAPASGQEVV